MIKSDDRKYQREIITCPVCKKENNKVLYRVNSTDVADHFVKFNKEQKYNKLKIAVENVWGGDKCSFYYCNDCGFCFAVPFIAANNNYYNILYSNSDYYPRWKWEFEVTLQKIHSLVLGNKIPNKFKMLEIGAGNGSFVEKIIEKFKGEPKIICVEYSESGCNAINRLNIDCFSKDIRVINNDAFHSFDVICMFQILEHLDDLDNYFKQLSNISNENCNLFISVPNFEHRSFFDSYNFIEDLPPHHVSRWNKNNLKIIGENFGWELANYKKEPFNYDAFIKKFRNTVLRNNRLINRINNNLLRKIIRQFDKLLSYFRLLVYLPKLKTNNLKDLGLAQYAHFIKKQK